MSPVVYPAPLDPVDRRAVASATLAAGLLIAQQVASRATRDALFLESYRVSSLPGVMMASAVVALLGAEALSRALARGSPARVVPRGAALSALLLMGEWAASFVVPRAMAVVVYLHIAAFGGALISGFWSLVNERFDPYTARRVVGRIGTGAAIGGVAGGALAWVLAHVLPVVGALPALAGLHALAAALPRCRLVTCDAFMADVVRRTGLDVRFRVRNVGRYAGAEVAQIYLGPAAETPAGVRQASRKLVQFERVTLAPGQAVDVALHVAVRELSYWSTEMQGWIRGAGERELLVGSSSRDVRLRGNAHVR